MQPFYDVPEDAWLFRQAVKACEADQKRKWTPHEERVRQWCLHELLRTYGININDIQIERSVKIGTRPLRADIVILKDGKPYIVIECKSRKETKHDEGMNQGISYAAAPVVNAQFAVYTNGDIWCVRRRIRDQWIPVPDLPHWNGECRELEWRDVLMLTDELDPILYWLDQTVPAKQAPAYFTALHEFFNGQNLLAANSNRHLTCAADNLLRVLSDINDHPGYNTGKMAATCKGLKEFCTEAGMYFGSDVDELWRMAHHSYASVSHLIDGSHDLTGPDIQLLRLIAALLSYMNGFHRHKRRIPYFDITSEIQSEVRKYLEITMAMQCSARLPDPLDKIYLGDIRESCEPAWLQHLNGEKR